MTLDQSFDDPKIVVDPGYGRLNRVHLVQLPGMDAFYCPWRVYHQHRGLDDQFVNLDLGIDPKFPDPDLRLLQMIWGGSDGWTPGYYPHKMRVIK